MVVSQFQNILNAMGNRNISDISQAVKTAIQPISSKEPYTDISQAVSNQAVFGNITLQTGGQSIGILGSGGAAGGGSYPISQVYSPSTEFINNITNQITNTASSYYSSQLTENITTLTESPSSTVTPYVTPSISAATTVTPAVTTAQTGQTPTTTLTPTATSGGGNDWISLIIIGAVAIGGVLILSKYLKKKKK